MCVGGILMSTIAMSGLYERTFSSRSSAVPLCPTISNPLSEQTGDALAKEHRVVGESDANRCLGLLGIGELGVDAPYCRRNQSALWEMSRVQRVHASNASIASAESSAFGMKPRAELSVTSAPEIAASRPEVRITSMARQARRVAPRRRSRRCLAAVRRR